MRRAAAAVGPALPSRVQRGVLAARAWVAGGVAVGLPDYQRVLALAPHPDDESLGFGGTLALLTAAGAQVTVVVASDGEATLGSALPATDVAALRRAEAEAAGAVLGVKTVHALGLPDGDLSSHVDAMATRIGSFLRDLRPELVLLPWFMDADGDHRALNDALAAASPGEDVDVWGAEVWTPLTPNRVVDITPVLDLKQAAIACHTTAAGAFDLTAGLGLNRFRSLQVGRGVGHAEAFLDLPAPRYCALVREHAQS